MPSDSQSKIRALRLANQRITGKKFPSASGVVGWLGAVQAQDFAGAKWGIGLRMTRGSELAIDEAFAHGSILRTHALRPTWHFVTPADIRWIQKLTAPRVHAQCEGMYRKSGLDRSTLRKSRRILERALRNGNTLTRTALASRLGRYGVRPGDGTRLAYIMMHAELECLICSGPRSGKQFTYALLDEKVPGTSLPDRDEALGELAARFFASRGPATPHDLAKWSSLTLADARRGTMIAGARLKRMTINGTEYWTGGSSPSPTRSPRACLLSVYDEYLSGYKDRSAICDPAVARKLASLGNGLGYVIVVNGRIVGRWRRTIGRTISMEMETYVPLRKTDVRAIRNAARHFGDFAGLPVSTGGLAEHA